MGNLRRRVAHWLEWLSYHALSLSRGLCSLAVRVAPVENYAVVPDPDYFTVTAHQYAATDIESFWSEFVHAEQRTLAEEVDRALMALGEGETVHIPRHTRA